jgi:hypothetical protein
MSGTTEKAREERVVDVPKARGPTAGFLGRLKKDRPLPGKKELYLMM